MADKLELDVFIEGEIVDLCIPTRAYALESDWYSWINNPSTNRYLFRGDFPNTPEDQLKFFESEREKRLLLIVSDKSDYIGVISLSGIDFVKSTADMAMVISSRAKRRMVPYISMEAIARITTHAMENMGLNRLNSGQHSDLKGWQQRKELLGYRLDGITRDGFVKGRDVTDLMISSLTFEDYQRVKAARGGHYWDSLDNMKQRIKKLPKRKFVDDFEQFMSVKGGEYYDGIFEL